VNSLKKILFILDYSDRLKAIRLLFLMLISVFLEAFGITLIIPILTLMIEKDIASLHPLIAKFVFYIGNPSQTELITIFLILLVIVIFVKNIFLSIYFWFQFTFIADVTSNLARKLLGRYLSIPYSEHIRRNSSLFIRNVTREVGFFNSLLGAYLMLSIEILMILFISTVVFLVEPIGLLIAISTLFISSYIFYLVTRDRTVRYGKQRLYHDGKRIYSVQESIGAIRDVIIQGRKDVFLKKFDFHSRETAVNERNYGFLRSLPRLFIEMIAIITFGFIVIISLNYFTSANSLLPILGFFAGAAIKLMPSINRIISSFQAIKYNTASINTIYDELKLSVRQEELLKTNEGITFKNSLILNNLEFSYPDPNKIILNKINLEIKPGLSIGFVGKSGSGKSTIVDLIVGLIEPLNGEILSDGVSIYSNLRSWQNNIGYVSQNIFLLDDTLKKNIAFGIPENLIDNSLVEKCIVESQLSSYVDSLPYGLDTTVGERGVRISGGQRQRVAIARALYSDPSFLIFDESTSALDTNTEKDIMNVVFSLKGKKTILIVSHRLSAIEKCDNVFKLEDGLLQPITL
jgi:ABC-type multidrug transport system fused ATPase/permease subunit